MAHTTGTDNARLDKGDFSLPASFQRFITHRQVDKTCFAQSVKAKLQPELSRQLFENKLQALEVNQPDIIATANIRSLSHLQSTSSKKVVHGIELLGKVTETNSAG